MDHRNHSDVRLSMGSKRPDQLDTVTFETCRPLLSQADHADGDSHDRGPVLCRGDARRIERKAIQENLGADTA